MIPIQQKKLLDRPRTFEYFVYDLIFPKYYNLYYI